MNLVSTAMEMEMLIINIFLLTYNLLLQIHAVPKFKYAWKPTIPRIHVAFLDPTGKFPILYLKTGHTCYPVHHSLIILPFETSIIRY